MVTKLIGIALLVLLGWFLRKLTVYREVNTRTTDAGERARLREEAKRKPYKPRFNYEPPKTKRW